MTDLFWLICKYLAIITGPIFVFCCELQVSSLSGVWHTQGLTDQIGISTVANSVWPAPAVTILSAGPIW